MRTLFDYGYERGKSGLMWQPTPAETIERQQRAPRVAASQ